jgi:hypothetical protein
MNAYRLKVKIGEQEIYVNTTGHNKDDAIDSIKRNVIGADVMECVEVTE